MSGARVIAVVLLPATMVVTSLQVRYRRAGSDPHVRRRGLQQEQ